MSHSPSQDWTRRVQHTVFFFIGCVCLVNTSWSDDRWALEYRAIRGWSLGFQIILDSQNRYNYIEEGFSAIGECTGMLSATDFKSIQLLVSSIALEDHPMTLSKPQAICSDEEKHYIQLVHGPFDRVAARYGFSAAPLCAAHDFPDSVSRLANKLKRIGSTKIKGKCLKEKALNPPSKPVLVSR